MKTIVIPGKGLPEFDALITAHLDLQSASFQEIEKEHIRIGVCNEYHLVYREIGVTRLCDLLRISNVLKAVGLFDGFGECYRRQEGYYAIYLPGRLH